MKCKMASCLSILWAEVSTLGARQICNCTRVSPHSPVDQNLMQGLILPLERNRAAHPRNHDHPQHPLFLHEGLRASPCQGHTQKRPVQQTSPVVLSTSENPRFRDKDCQSATSRCYLEIPGLTLIFDLMHAASWSITLATSHDIPTSNGRYL